LKCEASLSVALGYRDLKPAVMGACSLPGTPLAGRYERLLHDLRTAWTPALGRQAVEAVKALRLRIDALESDLSREIPQLGPAVSTVRTVDVQRRLAPDEALVEFVRYGGRYGAFLLPAKGQLQWRDVGAAAQVDRAVQDLIAAANDWSVALGGGERRRAASAEQTAGDALGTLSAKLGPVTAWLGQRSGLRRLRVAPDGMLQLVPFAALAGAGGKPLVEHLAISYLAAGRELIAPALPARPLTSAIVAVSPGPRGAAPASAFRADRLVRLAGAEREARVVQQWLPEAELLGEGQATEARVKQLHRPKVLHIVGHGIVRGAEDCAAGCQLAAIDPAARAMSLSAIVLEEAYGRGPGSKEDGLLTALELETLDLQGTEMLVLSQCRMADGVPASGDGVFGMRRAAAIAGVKTLVAPLWNVADQAQQALIGAFYKELAAGMGRAEALRRAQLHVMRNPATVSFLDWAPVILSGDPQPVRM
jgi:CHAT domain-containing protein